MTFENYTRQKSFIFREEIVYCAEATLYSIIEVSKKKSTRTNLLILKSTFLHLYSCFTSYPTPNRCDVTVYPIKAFLSTSFCPGCYTCQNPSAYEWSTRVTLEKKSILLTNGFTRDSYIPHKHPSPPSYILHTASAV